ncbi:MAG TPA: SDR family oxidoreductase [Propionibacteriaceae bacterium]
MNPTALPSLAVTGSTGALGRLVAEELAAAGVGQRLLVRTLAKAPTLPGSVPVSFAYADSAACAVALAGVDTLLMVSASESVDRLDQHRAFVDSVREAGVRHVVYTSFYGAAPDATFTLARDHAVTEDYLRASGVDVTFLRDNLYLDFMGAVIGEDDVIRGPAGDGRVAAVARADIARVAATVLQDPASHVGRTYDLTGPEALTLTEIASQLSGHLGRTIRFHDETLAEAYASREKWGAPDWQNDAWVSTYTAIAAGELAGVTDDVRAVTGRTPLSLRDLLARS